MLLLTFSGRPARCARRVPRCAATYNRPMPERPRILPAERALGCAGSVLAVPTLLPMMPLVASLVKGGRVTRFITLPVIFILFLIITIVFAPYYLLVRLLAKAGLVRLKMPASCVVVHRERVSA